MRILADQVWELWNAGETNNEAACIVWMYIGFIRNRSPFVSARVSGDEWASISDKANIHPDYAGGFSVGFTGIPSIVWMYIGFIRNRSPFVT